MHQIKCSLLNKVHKIDKECLDFLIQGLIKALQGIIPRVDTVWAMPWKLTRSYQ